jgi:hypothetical protein
MTYCEDGVQAMGRAWTVFVIKFAGWTEEQNY